MKTWIFSRFIAEVTGREEALEDIVRSPERTPDKNIAWSDTFLKSSSVGRHSYSLQWYNLDTSELFACLFMKAFALKIQRGYGIGPVLSANQWH